MWAIHGNWKLHYPICMYDVPKTTDCFSNNLNYVRTCPNAPEHGRAFCFEHMKAMKKSGVPTELKEYIEFRKHVTVTVQGTGKSMQSAQDVKVFTCKMSVMYIHSVIVIIHK